MDALRNIITNVPDWLKRLDELGTQIDQRQVELAALGIGSSGRSLKNRGSTESLKPKDDDESPFSSPVDGAAEEFPPTTARASGATTPPQNGHRDPANAPPSSPGSGTPSGLQKQTQQAMARAQARARAQVRKRHRTQSVMSGEGSPSKYRTRSMIIVYYDSYVQGFFEELVRFVSASRNLMRKAKMAAKVAQIRRLAELEMPDEDEEDGDGTLQSGSALLASSATEGLPSLRYMSTRRMGARGASGVPAYTRAGQGGILGDSSPDAYDDLDKGLEYVQATCEHAAHQFLRDGECIEEIGNIQRRLAETRELAVKEMTRVEKEEPELLKEANEATKVRTLRPTSMRRELTPVKDIPSPKKLEADEKIEAQVPRTGVLEVDKMGPLVADGPMEADDDEGIDDMDMPPPKLVYKSTRRMRGP